MRLNDGKHPNPNFKQMSPNQNKSPQAAPNSGDAESKQAKTDKIQQAATASPNYAPLSTGNLTQPGVNIVKADNKTSGSSTEINGKLSTGAASSTQAATNNGKPAPNSGAYGSVVAYVMPSQQEILKPIEQHTTIGSEATVQIMAFVTDTHEGGELTIKGRDQSLILDRLCKNAVINMQPTNQDGSVTINAWDMKRSDGHKDDKGTFTLFTDDNGNKIKVYGNPSKITYINDDKRYG